MIKLILATDMTNHFKMTSELCQIELPEVRLGQIHFQRVCVRVDVMKP